MQKGLRLGGFGLVLVGFVGLMVTEFAGALEPSSRSLTIAFAVVSAVGLATLAFSYLGMRNGD